jgi:hypothetical protein
MNRTKGFVNLNRFKASQAIKRLTKVTDDKYKMEMEKRRQRSKK